jgi:AcrR family transcriptional regulator
MPTSVSASVQKRSNLVRAATELLHEQGFQRTTLAHVATRADVPLGNVYYYFKTKEDLAEAVIASHEEALHALFGSWEEASRDPRVRLRKLVRAPLDSPGIVEFGCPHGSLCQELEKLGPDAPLARAAARLLTTYIDWAKEQLRSFGFATGEARELATELVACIQGTMLLAHTLRSREVLSRQLRRVEGWLEDQLSPPGRRS